MCVDCSKVYHKCKACEQYWKCVHGEENSAVFEGSTVAPLDLLDRVARGCSEGHFLEGDETASDTHSRDAKQCRTVI